MCYLCSRRSLNILGCPEGECGGAVGHDGQVLGMHKVSTSATTHERAHAGSVLTRALVARPGKRAPSLDIKMKACAWT